MFTKDEREFLKAAVKAGAVLTTPIHSIGPLGHQAIKEIKITLGTKPIKF